MHGLIDRAGLELELVFTLDVPTTRSSVRALLARIFLPAPRVFLSSPAKMREGWNVTCDKVEGTATRVRARVNGRSIERVNMSSRLIDVVLFFFFFFTSNRNSDYGKLIAVICSNWGLDG